MNNHPVKMALFEFKGEETINEWALEIAEIAIQMSCAKDQQGLPIYVDINPMILAVNSLCDQIRRCMNNKTGAMLIKVPHSTDLDFNDDDNEA